MNKLVILESMYAAIKDSLEWSLDSNGSYGYFVDGIMAMTEKMLETLDNKLNCGDKLW